MRVGKGRSYSGLHHGSGSMDWRYSTHTHRLFYC